MNQNVKPVPRPAKINSNQNRTRRSDKHVLPSVEARYSSTGKKRRGPEDVPTEEPPLSVQENASTGHRTLAPAPKRARTTTGGSSRPALAPINARISPAVATSLSIIPASANVPKPSDEKKTRTAPERTSAGLQAWMAEAAEYIRPVLKGGRVVQISKEVVEYYTALLTKVDRFKGKMTAEALEETGLKNTLEEFSVKEGMPSRLGRKAEQLVGYWDETAGM